MKEEKSFDMPWNQDSYEEFCKLPWGKIIQDISNQTDDELDKLLPWTKTAQELGDIYGVENLNYTLKTNGLINNHNIPIIRNPEFRYFRVVDVGFTDSSCKWHSFAVTYFVTLRGLVKILAIMQKATPIQLS